MKWCTAGTDSIYEHETLLHFKCNLKILMTILFKSGPAAMNGMWITSEALFTIVSSGWRSQSGNGGATAPYKCSEWPSRNRPEEFRLLDSVGKFVEFLRTRILRELNERWLLCDDQCGFSTQTQDDAVLGRPCWKGQQKLWRQAANRRCFHRCG